MKRSITPSYRFRSFSQTTSSGIKLLYTPNRNNYSTITFIINGGATYKNNNDSLMYSHLIASGLKDNDLFNFLLKNSTTFTSDIELSSTYYQFNAFFNIEEIITYFVNKINSLNINEEMIKTFIRLSQKVYPQPYSLLKKSMCDNLFISSPMKKSILFTTNDISDCTINNAKEFFLDMYKPSNITIHIAGPLITKEIKRLFINLDKTIKFFKGSDTIKENSYSENYSSINKGFVLIQSRYESTFLGYGFKLPQTEQLVARFDSLVIPYLYLTKVVCFDLNSDFIQSVSNIESEFISSSIETSGKESYLFLLFKTNKEERLMKLINEYSLRLQIRFSKELFISAKKYAFASLYDQLNHPSSFIKSINYPFKDVISYTKMVRLIKKVRYDDLIDFILFLTSLLKSIVVLKSSSSEK